MHAQLFDSRTMQQKNVACTEERCAPNCMCSILRSIAAFCQYFVSSCHDLYYACTLVVYFTLSLQIVHVLHSIRPQIPVQVYKTGNISNANFLYKYFFRCNQKSHRKELSILNKSRILSRLLRTSSHLPFLDVVSFVRNSYFLSFRVLSFSDTKFHLLVNF